MSVSPSLSVIILWAVSHSGRVAIVSIILCHNTKPPTGSKRLVTPARPSTLGTPATEYFGRCSSSWVLAQLSRRESGERFQTQEMTVLLVVPQGHTFPTGICLNGVFSWWPHKIYSISLPAFSGTGGKLSPSPPTHTHLPDILPFRTQLSPLPFCQEKILCNGYFLN